MTKTDPSSGTTLFKVLIQKDIPIPPSGRTREGRESRYKYPVDLLKVGDSFFVPLDKSPYSELQDLQSYISASASTYGAGVATAGKARPRFVTRRVKENGAEGIRIWRVRSNGPGNNGAHHTVAGLDSDQ